MRLYLARHGEYTIENAKQLDVLTEKGRNDITQLASLLRASHIAVASIFHSSKYRAQQTAELLSQGVSCEQPIQIRNGLQPNDDVIAFANEVTSWNEDVLVVGHLPFMGRLVSQLLVGNQNKDLIDFQPGTMVCIETIDLERWIIRWVIEPGTPISANF